MLVIQKLIFTAKDAKVRKGKAKTSLPRKTRTIRMTKAPGAAMPGARFRR
ncbi:MAG: hypothetical protein ACOY5W_08000 [Pseudomonadota bacterium]